MSYPHRKKRMDTLANAHWDDLMGLAPRPMGELTIKERKEIREYIMNLKTSE